jgi:hypothetical protein
MSRVATKPRPCATPSVEILTAELTYGSTDISLLEKSREERSNGLMDTFIVMMVDLKK